MADGKAGRAWSGAGCAVSQQRTDVGVLRVCRDDAAAGTDLGRSFGIIWPVQPNSMSGGDLRVAWLAPDSWAIFAPPREVEARIKAACADRLFSYVDVSAGRSLWRIAGAKAPELVSAACSIDVHPRVFGAGRCAQSLFAQVPALIMRGDDEATFEVLADASFDGHLAEWFDNSVAAAA